MNHIKTMAFTYVLLFLFCSPSYSGSLKLPKSAKSIITNISEQCEDCLENGFSPTGTMDIGFGKRFFPNFFSGTPEIGFLVSHIMTGEKYKTLIRENEYEKAKDILVQEFNGIKLFVIEKSGFKVHILKKSEEVSIVLKEGLHQCLHNTEKPLCCCCTTRCQDECCEKKLGSTHILVRWKDPLNENQTIEYRYSPHSGDSIIYNVNISGKRINLKWCLDSTGPGVLKLE